jgi:hypothetical protein
MGVMPTPEVLTERTEDKRVQGDCKLNLIVTRSEIVAFGEKAIGQPTQSGTPFISVNSTEDEITDGSCVSALSRAQIEMQAANTHIKLTGSKAATNLLHENAIANIGKIIQIKAALIYFEGFRTK